MDLSSAVDLSAELARRLKAARALSGKKVRELANELGWSDEKVYRLERGAQVPDALELDALALATGQPLEFFLPGRSTSSDPEGPRVLPSPLPPVNGDDEP